MKGIEYDPSQTGFNAVLKNWQLKAMQVIWDSPEGANSREVWENVNRMLDNETISRASIINFLQAMLEMDVLDADDCTGKGGHRSIYKMGMNEEQYKHFIATTLIDSMMHSFPKETKAVLEKVLQS